MYEKFQTHVKLFWMIALSGYIVWSFWPLWGVKIDSRKPVITPRDDKRKNEWPKYLFINNYLYSLPLSQIYKKVHLLFTFMEPVLPNLPKFRVTLTIIEFVMPLMYHKSWYYSVIQSSSWFAWVFHPISRLFNIQWESSSFGQYRFWDTVTWK